MTSNIQQPGKNLSVADQRVGDYYDDNTKLFLKRGEHGATNGIHQPLFVNDTTTLTEAMHVHHDEILNRLGPFTAESKVLDLGCGVGASMLHLASRTNQEANFQGITLSGRQHQLGMENIAQSDAINRVSIVQGSYLNLPESCSDMTAAYAIESVIHCSDFPKFLSEVFDALRPGSKLLLFDDFLRRQPKDHQERKIIEDFAFGWRANNLHSIEDVIDMTSQHGFTIMDRIDYSAALQLNRPRDRIIRATIPFVRPFKNQFQYARFLVGGNARQQAYQHDLLGYFLLEFQKL